MIPIQPDARPYMKAALAVFSGKAPKSELEKFSVEREKSSRRGLFAGGMSERTEQEAFYAELYLGLLEEAAGNGDCFLSPSLSSLPFSTFFFQSPVPLFGPPALFLVKSRAAVVTEFRTTTGSCHTD